MSVPKQNELQPKPVVNLTKVAFTRLCDHIKTKRTDHEEIIEILTTALKETTGFCVDAKKPKEVYERQANLERERLAREGVTQYEKYKKKTYEKRKEKYPQIPTKVLARSERAIETWITNLQDTSRPGVEQVE